MTRKRSSVASIATEAQLPTDDALVLLWDAGFVGISGPDDMLQPGEANRARRALGLSTRRELGSPTFWADRLACTNAELLEILKRLGVERPLEGARLSTRAIHRLGGEFRRQSAAMRSEQQLKSNVDCKAEAPVAPALVWETIGHESGMSFLRVDQVIAIHEALVEDFSSGSDPIDPPGIRSQPLVESAVNRPATHLGIVAKYPTIEMAGAALLHALVHDHPFHNGNKRTALVSMIVFLDENGMVLTCEEDALFQMVLQLAKHAIASGPRAELPDREVLAVARWLKANCRWVEMGNRAISWRRLQQILSAYDCECAIVPSHGTRMNVSRKVQRRVGGFFGPRIKTEELHTQTAYGDPGREVDRGSVQKIRLDLQLDDEHGIDSAAFYDKAAAPPSEFIRRYRMTLRRLARL